MKFEKRYQKERFKILYIRKKSFYDNLQNN